MSGFDSTPEPEAGRQGVVGVPGFDSAPEPEASLGFVGVPEDVSAPQPEAGRRDVVGVPGFLRVLRFVSASEPKAGRQDVVGVPGFDSAPELEAGRGFVGVPEVINAP